MLRIRDFVSALRAENPEKLVCFCSDPKGLQFYRFKMRGAQLLQIELNENVCRDEDGRLTVDSLSVADFDPKEYAKSAGELLKALSDPTIQHYELIFGGDRDALKFVGIRECGEWLSIEFEARVHRVASGFCVEEIRDGQHVREVIPYAKEVDPSEAGGAFAAIRRTLGEPGDNQA